MLAFNAYIVEIEEYTRVVKLGEESCATEEEADRCCESYRPGNGGYKAWRRENGGYVVTAYGRGKYTKEMKKDFQFKYVEASSEEEARKKIMDVYGKFYKGRKMRIDLEPTPVHERREATGSLGTGDGQGLYGWAMHYMDFC